MFDCRLLCQSSDSEAKASSCRQSCRQPPQPRVCNRGRQDNQRLRPQPRNNTTTTTSPFLLPQILQNIRHVFRLELLPGRPEWSPRRAPAIQLISKSARPATTSATGLHEPQSHRLWPTSSSAAKFHRIPYAAAADWLPTTPADATAANWISRPATAIQQCSSTAATELPNRCSANAPDSSAIPESSSATASCGPGAEASAYWLCSDGR